MFFLTSVEADEWSKRNGIPIRGEGPRAITMTHGRHLRISLEGSNRAVHFLGRQITSWLGPFESCLLWVGEFGIWPSWENLHLYYRLRVSYGDSRQLQAAPGHLFLGHEIADLSTLLSLAIQFGWGGAVYTSPFRSAFWLSHDGEIHISTEGDIEAIAKQAIELSLPVSEVTSMNGTGDSGMGPGLPSA